MFWAFIFEGGVIMDMTNKNSITTENTTSKKTKTAKIRVREMTFIALMGALSTILLMFRFPLPFMPPFLSFDLAGVIEIIGGFMFGPLAAFLIILLKILLQLVIQGSYSIGTGELQNLILSCSYVMPALFIYKRKKSKKNAIIGMLVGTICVSVVAIFSNLYLIIPFYTALCGMTVEDIVAMCSAVNPAMKDTLSMALLGIFPFNLIKYGVSSVFTFVLYKKLSRPIRAFINKE